MLISTVHASWGKIYDPLKCTRVEDSNVIRCSRSKYMKACGGKDGEEFKIKGKAVLEES